MAFLDDLKHGFDDLKVSASALIKDAKLEGDLTELKTKISGHFTKVNASIKSPEEFQAYEREAQNFINSLQIEDLKTFSQKTFQEMDRNRRQQNDKIDATEKKEAVRSVTMAVVEEEQAVTAKAKKSKTEAEGALTKAEASASSAKNQADTAHQYANEQGGLATAAKQATTNAAKAGNQAPVPSPSTTPKSETRGDMLKKGAESALKEVKSVPSNIVTNLGDQAKKDAASASKMDDWLAASGSEMGAAVMSGTGSVLSAIKKFLFTPKDTEKPKGAALKLSGAAQAVAPSTSPSGSSQGVTPAPGQSPQPKGPGRS